MEKQKAAENTGPPGTRENIDHGGEEDDVVILENLGNELDLMKRVDNLLEKTSDSKRKKAKRKVKDKDHATEEENKDLRRNKQYAVTGEEKVDLSEFKIEVSRKGKRKIINMSEDKGSKEEDATLYSESTSRSETNNKAAKDVSSPVNEDIEQRGEENTPTSSFVNRKRNLLRRQSTRDSHDSESSDSDSDQESRQALRTQLERRSRLKIWEENMRNKSRSLKAEETIREFQRDEQKELGFTDIFIYFQKSLETDYGELLSKQMANKMVGVWKSSNYQYPDLEEMYLVNISRSRDRQMIARELGSTLGKDREGLPTGVTCIRLVELTISFFNSEPRVQEKLANNLKTTGCSAEMPMGSSKKAPKRSRSRSSSVENKPKKKMSKFDSLKPISNFINSTLTSNGLESTKAELIVFDITERLVTAGFNWDKILQYHSKGEDKFTKKLIPHIFMSKDEFPAGLTANNVLQDVFEFIDNWKIKLFNMISGNNEMITQEKIEPQPKVIIKEESDLTHEINKDETKKNMKEWRVLDNNVEVKSIKPSDKSNEEIALKDQESKGFNKTKSEPIIDLPASKWDMDVFFKKDSIPVKISRTHKKEEMFAFTMEKGLNYKNNSPILAKPESSHETDINSNPTKKKQKKIRSRNNSTDSNNSDSDDTLRQILKKRLRKTTNKEINHDLNEIDEDSVSSSERYIEEDSKSSEGSNDDTQSSSSEEGKEGKKGNGRTLLEKVNEIIKSCVKLKEEKNITGDKLTKANMIIEKATEKKNKLCKIDQDKIKSTKIPPLNENKVRVEYKEKNKTIKNIEKNNDLKQIVKITNTTMALEEGEISSDASDDEVDDDLKAVNKVSAYEEAPFIRKKKVKSEHRKRKRRHSSESETRSYKSSIIDELQAMSGKSNKHVFQKHSMKSSRSRSRSISRSQSRSWSPHQRYPPRSQSPGGYFYGPWSQVERSPHYHHHQYRPRSPVPQRQSQHWIPITPCTIQDDINVEGMSSVTTSIKAKGEFSFKDNAGCMVRITKWTGKDSVLGVHIRPQIVSLDTKSHVKIEVENPGGEDTRTLQLMKHDKIACLSILSAPTPGGFFSRLNCSPDRYETPGRRWFKVTTVVLHKKGSLDRITIQSGRTMKVIATVIGPLKKHVGKEVLISQLEGVDDFPIESQICQICENENIGIDVTNHGSRPLTVEKGGQAVACLSVWATVQMEDNPHKIPY